MYFIPFIERKFKTKFSPEKITGVLKKTTSPAGWKIDVNKLFNFKIIEGEFSQNRFVIVTGGYALTYGSSSLLPIMKGKFDNSKGDGYTDITIVIHPFETGIIVLSLFYLLAFAGLYMCIHKGLASGIIVISIFLLSSYNMLIAKFNGEVRTYFSFMENEMNAFLE